MGDPKKLKKKYKTPSHPWQKNRIDSEKVIIKNYELKNKKEIWKSESKLNKFKEQAKRLVQLRTEQARKEEKQLLEKLYKLSLLKKDANLSDVLSLNLNNILDRRLQSQIYKNKLAKSMKQARQFITHGHIIVNGKKITVPSYLILRDEENKISFTDTSPIKNKDHPERLPDERLKKEIIKKETKVKKEKPKEQKQEVKKEEKKPKEETKK